MKHALVIGGTGMLAGVSSWLVTEGYHVSVIGRSKEKMMRLLEQQRRQPAMITQLLLDYHEEEELTMKMRVVLATYGDFSLVVVWIHSNRTANDVLQLLRQLTEKQELRRIVHVVGSRANLATVREKITVLETERYQIVQLGWIPTASGRRMLTHEEICTGLIASINDEQAVRFIGHLQ